MSNQWPTVSGEWRQEITIWHALPKLGNPGQHMHVFGVRFGWKHEINPTFGHTWTIGETADNVRAVLALVDDKNLNEVMAPWEPTAELLACWLLVRTPAFYDWCEIECYDNYRVRVERKGLPKEFKAKFLGEAVPLSLTA